MKLNIFCFLSALSLNLLPGVITQANGQDLISDYVKEFATLHSSDNENDEAASSGLTSSVPLGELKGPVPPDCHPDQFKLSVLNQYQTANQYSNLVTAYFERCSPYLVNGNLTGFPGLAKFAMTEYQLEENPQISKQTLILSDGSRIESYIGVKDLTTPRPWVIAKCGVFCDVTSSPSSLNYIINLFDQSPFNVIFLSNRTGNDHIRLNSSLTIGGFYEVYDYYDIAQWLKFDSPYKQTVESMHALGMSLGGSAALAVSHLSSHYRSRDGKPLFNSTTAICPVVNLQPTLKDMYADTFKGRMFTRMTWKYLKEAAPYLHDAQDYLAQKDPPPAKQFPAMISDIVFRYGRKWDQQMPPGRNVRIPTSIEDLLSRTQFSDDSRTPDIPTFIWASHDDQVVSFSLNTDTILNLRDHITSQGAVGLEYGDHCGFATSYGFSPTTAVMQSFIINNSPGFKPRRKINALKFPGAPLDLPAGEIHLRQWWEAAENKNFVTLNYETFNSNISVACRFADPFNPPSHCTRVYQQEIPLQSLGPLGFLQPKTPTMAQVLSRQLNAGARLFHYDLPIDGEALAPTHIRWESY